MFQENNSPIPSIPSQNEPQKPTEPSSTPPLISPPKGFSFKLDKNSILMGVAVLAVIIVVVLIFTTGSNVPYFLVGSGSKNTVAENAMKYLNENILQPGQVATLKNVSGESGVIKIQVKIGGNTYDSYVTRDGKLFFPQAYNISQTTAGGNNSGNITRGNVSFDITSENHIRGNVSAPITLVEFSDFECPFCESHVPTLERILSEYKDKVRLVYKHFPLTNIHPNAQKAAEASECASEQGKFWEYHDILFKNQKSGLGIDKFKSWAVQLGLNASQFNNCLDSSKYKSKVDADTAEGASKRVNGTPATFINGELVEGAVPYESFKVKIDTLLSK
ncbi:MAG: DsbA family protein [Patescibacteria group bacterium]